MQSGLTDWHQVSLKLNERVPTSKRSGKQCRERWSHHLSPDISKEVWTEAEQQKLFYYHQVYGNQWMKIASLLPGRSDNSIKNFFNLSIKKAINQHNQSVSFEEQIHRSMKSLIRDKKITATLGLAQDYAVPNAYADVTSQVNQFEHVLTNELKNCLQSLSWVYFVLSQLAYR